MNSMKTFKRSSVALLALLGMSCGMAQAATKPLIGVQLWSVKDEVKADFEGTLSKIAALGIQGVEFAGEFGPYGKDPAGLKAFLAKTKLKCAGAHMHFDALAADKIAATTSFYKTVGCSNLIISMDKRAFTKEGVVEVAKELTALAPQLAKHGMKLGYHNHAGEMATVEGNTTPWDMLATSTPKGTILQQDVGWTTFAGKDPVAYVKKYPGRTVSTHYKAKFLEGTTGVNIIGQDKTDWAGVTKAARSVGGTQWIIIEQEDYPNGMGQLESVAASMKGLQAILAKMPAK